MYIYTREDYAAMMQGITCKEAAPAHFIGHLGRQDFDDTLAAMPPQPKRYLWPWGAR